MDWHGFIRQTVGPSETRLHNRRIFVLLAMSGKGKDRSPVVGAAINQPSTNDADVSQHH
jgi:hypothetical protein